MLSLSLPGGPARVPAILQLFSRSQKGMAECWKKLSLLATHKRLGCIDCLSSLTPDTDCWGCWPTRGPLAACRKYSSQVATEEQSEGIPVCFGDLIACCRTSLQSLPDRSSQPKGNLEFALQLVSCKWEVGQWQNRQWRAWPISVSLI